MIERIERLAAETIPEVIRSSATLEEIERWAGEATDAICSICGRQALKRYERMNRRCERCRKKYLAKVYREEGRRAKPDCPTCEGSGWKPAGGEDDRWTRCRCTEPPDPLAEAMRKAGVPPGYRSFSLETWEGEIPEAVGDFLLSPELARVLYLSGLQGRGKTHLATAVFRELLARGADGAWRDCPETVERCRRFLRQGEDEEYDQEIFRLREVEVLLLDDFGAGRATEYGDDVLDQVVRHRHAQGKILLVTANRSLLGLVTPRRDGGLGRDPAVADRLRGVEYEIEGPDRRAA